MLRIIKINDLNWTIDSPAFAELTYSLFIGHGYIFLFKLQEGIYKDDQLRFNYVIVKILTIIYMIIINIFNKLFLEYLQNLSFSAI